MEGSGLLQSRVGGVPVVVIVGLGAGAIAILLALRGRGAAVQSGGDALSPSAAEAFGTLQQQGQDLGNALSALNANQQGIVSNQLAEHNFNEYTNWQQNANFWDIMGQLNPSAVPVSARPDVLEPQRPTPPPAGLPFNPQSQVQTLAAG